MPKLNTGAADAAEVVFGVLTFAADVPLDAPNVKAGVAAPADVAALVPAGAAVLLVKENGFAAMFALVAAEGPKLKVGVVAFAASAVELVCADDLVEAAEAGAGVNENNDFGWACAAESGAGCGAE